MHHYAGLQIFSSFSKITLLLNDFKLNLIWEIFEASLRLIDIEKFGNGIKFIRTSILPIYCKASLGCGEPTIGIH